MRTVRLSRVLPGTQIVIAVVLTAWGNRVPGPRYDTLWVSTMGLICEGINAPAVPLGILGVLINRSGPTIPSIYGFGAWDLFFLTGVVLLWFWVGRAVDHRKSRASPQRMPISRAGLNLVLMTYGAFIFSLALTMFRNPWILNNRVGTLTEGVLFAVWSLVLILVGTVNIGVYIRAKLLDPRSAK